MTKSKWGSEMETFRKDCDTEARDGKSLTKPSFAPLQAYTPARVGLPRAGSAISTAAQLAFQLDHARARDAVHDSADFSGLMQGLTKLKLDPILLQSAVPGGPGGRQGYLRRPDLGRRLDTASAASLTNRSQAAPPDVVFVVADGLSALAIDRHAVALLEALLPLLGDTWKLGPVCVVRNGRVAIGDEIGALLDARMTVMFIGERPGLTAPDSLGVYLTWEPRRGRTDAERNCISNIRTEGLSYTEAAQRILFYMNAARATRGTGYALKESSSPNLPPIS